jgi:hypothetical protein
MRDSENSTAIPPVGGTELKSEMPVYVGLTIAAACGRKWCADQRGGGRGTGIQPSPRILE